MSYNLKKRDSLERFIREQTFGPGINGYRYVDLDDEKITLNNPNDIYYKKYEEVKTKARTAKTETIRLLLEAKQLKELYMLEDSDSDDSYLDFDEL